MPTYSYECEQGHQFDRVLPLSEYKSPQTCDCGSPARKKLVAPMFYVRPFESYESPASGRIITNEKQRKEDLAETDCIEYDPEIRKDHIRREREEDKALDRKVDEVVEKEISAMSSEKKEALAKDLATSELTYERGTANG